MKHLIGIYRITHIETNKSYIGSSKAITRRLTEHRSKLRANKHHNQYLQNTWNKYGENAFEFIIIAECSVEQLIQLEQKYLNDCLENTFNLSLDVSQVASWTEERKDKLRERNKKLLKGKKRTPEQIAKMREARKGIIHSDEAREKMSETRKGIPCSDLRRQRIIDSCPNKKEWPSLVSPDGTVYENIKNLTAFAKQHNLSESGLRFLINGTKFKKGKYKGWSVKI